MTRVSANVVLVCWWLETKVWIVMLIVTNGWDGSHDLTKLQLVQNGGLA